MGTDRLVLYTAKICPFSQRVRIALEEAGAPYTNYEIDLNNKPDWYNTQINPVSKVPAIAYGGPSTEPDKPSDESVKLTESAVLVEFISDLYPEAKLIPESPVERAQARLFVDFVNCRFLPAFLALIFKGDTGIALVSALEAIQQRLPRNSTFFGGEKPNVADITIAPFLARLQLQLKNDIGMFPEGEGLKLYHLLFKSQQFYLLKEYADALTARESFKKTFDEEYLLAKFRERLGHFRRAKSVSPPPPSANESPSSVSTVKAAS